MFIKYKTSSKTQSWFKSTKYGMLKDNDMYKKQSYIFDEWRVYRLVFYLWYGLNHDQLQKVNVTADAICSKLNDGTLKSNIHHSY